ncbi:hypothetical protein VTK26DRAFT_7273 [Humicola hyalothermophila]
MGVQGLWTIVHPCARPTNLETLNRKRLAIDASIWIYQFLKAVRDKEGNALRNSHVVGFFRRICKLLWYGIKPVFVFDGGAPALKRATLQARRRRREGRREDAARTAGKLLAVQMQRLAEEEEEKRKRAVTEAKEAEEEQQEQLPSMDQIVYADELGMSKQERQRNRRFHKQDAYHLPELENSIEAMGKPNDPRIMSVEELEEYARQFNNGEDINLYDFSKIDFDGEFFKSLPPADRYNILNAARIRSRLRMGLSKEQLDGMFPDRMAFSRFQIERVRERNHLTQRLMHEMGMAGTDLTINVNRIAGDRNREYILVKNEGAEGGWALGVVSRDKDRGQIHKPIDVDALDFQYQGQGDDEDEDELEDEEFEDVPIEGVNRLPKLSQASQGLQQGNWQAHAEESLFVENDDAASLLADDVIQADEEEDINRAIALSLRNQHGSRLVPDEADGNETEDLPAPQWEQKAVEAPKPIVSTSGRMVAHIVNNRASAAVPRRRNSESSNSDVDLQSALAAARKKQPRAKPPPVKRDVKNPFDGPLPFEKLDWRGAFGGKGSSKVEEPKKPQEVETGDLEAVSDDESGGFVRERESEAPHTETSDKPLPLPPWLANDTDIRESVRKQQEMEIELSARTAEMDEELRLRRRQDDEVVEIESSSEDGSEVEIIDAPPVKQPVGTSGASSPLLKDDITMQHTEQDAGITNGDALPKTDSISQPISQDNSQESVVSGPPEDSEDEEAEFEDVVLPAQPQAVDSPSLDAHMSEEAQIEAELFGEDAPPPAQPTRTEGLAPPQDESIDPDAPGPEEFESDHDSEEEELLLRMAEEAEEHARFASQLNNKSQRENQEAYEQELRALRTQQKKDRRDADEVTQIMVTECQALLRLFGIPYITAPMEAEAQCAELVRLGLVDGIVTDDSDTFLFGGTRVYKNVFNSNKYVECYLARDLETELSLSRERLIALAQLLGSDYTEGLPGVGPVTALEILSEFPRGGCAGLEAFRDWWQDVQNRGRAKDADAASPFRRKFRKSHATKLFLPVGFPSPAVFDAYLQPEVDSNPEPFQWGVPDVEGLRQFLMGTIGWGQERTDEVLLPVVRDMNRREMEGTQSNITRYFGGGVGVGARQGQGQGQSEAFAPRQRAEKGSRRMAEAVSRLKARRANDDGEEDEGGNNSSGLLTGTPVVAPGKKAKRGGRKRKARAAAADEDGAEEGDGSGEEDGGDEGGWGRGKGRAKGKRSRA